MSVAMNRGSMADKPQQSYCLPDRNSFSFRPDTCCTSAFPDDIFKLPGRQSDVGTCDNSGDNGNTVCSCSHHIPHILPVDSSDCDNRDGDFPPDFPEPLQPVAGTRITFGGCGEHR